MGGSLLGEGRGMLDLVVVLLLAVGLLSTATAGPTQGQKVARLIGVGECGDCAEKNVNSVEAFKGIHVAVVCDAGNEQYVPKAMGQLHPQHGKYSVQIPNELLKEDGTLKKDCFAQLFVTAKNAPCPAKKTERHHYKLVLAKSNHDSMHVFRISAGNLTFSHSSCSAAFMWPHPCFKTPPSHPWHKPLPKFTLPPFPCHKPYTPTPTPAVHSPPPAPVYSPPPTPVYTPPTPVVKKPCPPPEYKPPTPVYKPPTPVYEPPTPVYKPPEYHPIHKKPCPPIPFHKSPPTYKKPMPKFPPLPPFSFHKKPCPPIPFHKFPPMYKKPMPKFPPLPPFSFHHHPKFGYSHPSHAGWPPMPSYPGHPLMKSFVPLKPEH